MPSATRRASTARRLGLTVFLVYAVFLTSNVARETYLAVGLGDQLTVRLDTFAGLHPDLFRIEGRGVYINSNPGASLLGAVPYAASRPLVAALFALKPELARPKPPAAYDDPRPNRAPLMNAMRARGLDVKLALAAFATQLGLMAPLGALSAVLMFALLRRRLADERAALALALVFAFVTPLLFRSAYLNQNALLAHATFGAFVLGSGEWWKGAGRWTWVGVLMGTGILLDYSAAPLALVFGCWALWDGWREGGVAEALGRGTLCLLGAVPPLVLLFGYQWAAFGSPWYPAQRYMPPTEFSVIGWNGMTVPSPRMIWDNLFDLRYGLFAFCPLLLAAAAAPWLRGARGAPPRRELIVIFAATVALLLFNAANQFSNLQWNTGVRYMVPAAPLLFLAVVPVLLRAPAWLRWVLVAPAAVISLAVTMTREDVPTALRLVATEGPTLPMLIVLKKTAAAYAPWLGSTLPFALAAFAGLGAALWLVWRRPAAAPAEAVAS